MPAKVGVRRPVRRAVKLGDTVIVTVGEGGFLKVRSQRGLSGVERWRVAPSTELQVIDGPVDADNYRWWKVTNGKDITGWAAEGTTTERWLTPIE